MQIYDIQTAENKKFKKFKEDKGEKNLPYIEAKMRIIYLASPQKPHKQQKKSEVEYLKC